MPEQEFYVSDSPDGRLIICMRTTGWRVTDTNIYEQHMRPIAQRIADLLNNIFDLGVHMGKRNLLAMPKEFAEKMEAFSSLGDRETRHQLADSLMVRELESLGYAAGCKIYDAMEKWHA